MNIRQINEEYSVSGQITVEDVATIKELGFKSIVCHRPDGEEMGQPDFGAVAARAAELGLPIRHIPIGPMGVTPDAVVAMADVLDDFERPIFGYCRSGARSTAAYDHALRQRG